MIAIVDYDMGNLRSVQKGFASVGHDAVVTCDPHDLQRADKLVLPGVGAFSDAMSALRDRRLIEPLREQIRGGKPTLGICLGMQLLFETSYEDGEHHGLGLLPGKVVQFDLPRELKVPHMGWNAVEASAQSPLYRDVPAAGYFYFVHCFYCVPAEGVDVIGWTDYGGRFAASVQYGNLYATQFHPEKSQRLGLQLLKNFAELPAG